MTSVDIRTVRTYGDPDHRVVDATVTAGQVTHRIGWVPSEGWWCDCPSPRTCQHITTISTLVPALADHPSTWESKGGRATQ